MQWLLENFPKLLEQLLDLSKTIVNDYIWIIFPVLAVSIALACIKGRW